MLNEKQRGLLHTALLNRRVQLQALIGDEVAIGQGGRAERAGGEVGDFGDEPVGADLARTEDALVGLHRDELRQIQLALDRLADGRYGVCVDCGDPIGFERLNAALTCTRCGPCQRRHEGIKLASKVAR